MQAVKAIDQLIMWSVLQVDYDKTTINNPFLTDKLVKTNESFHLSTNLEMSDAEVTVKLDPIAKHKSTCMACL
jgi:hypothetical protein